MFKMLEEDLFPDCPVVFMTPLPVPSVDASLPAIRLPLTGWCGEWALLGGGVKRLLAKEGWWGLEAGVGMEAGLGREEAGLAGCMALY